ncbi:hypothetical protein ANCCAN_22709, partial [Ancylostoma caninum]
FYSADSQKGEQRVKVLLQRPSSCTYFINGTRTTQRAVRDLVASYNIQIDNPCTFLAQDKVKSFSEQSPVELLMNTERAGNPGSLEKHEELIKKKKHESVFVESAREVQQRLQSIEGEMDALLPRVQNYKKKEFLRTKIKVLQKKKAIMLSADFKESEERFTVEEAAVDLLQARVKEEEKQVQHLKKKTEKETSLEKDYSKMHADLLRQIRTKSDELHSVTNKSLYSEKMTVPDAESAMLLENLVAVRDLPMFIFGCKADEAVLTDQRHKWKLNSTVIPPEQVDISALKTGLTSDMKKFGFNRFAADLFTAPDVVKQYLCSVARLHQVPIGSSKTNDAYEAIKSAFVNTPFRLYLTDKYRVQFTISKYGSHEVLGQQSELRMSPKIFVAHSSNFDENKKLVDEKQRLRDKEKELRDRRAQAKEARAALQKVKETLKARQVEWKTRRDNLINLERSLSSRESKLESLSATRPDIEQARAALNEAKLQASKEVHKMVLKMLTKVEQLRALSVEETLVRTALQGLRAALGKVDAELHEAQQKLQENLTLLEGRLACFRDAMRDLNRAKEILQEECGLTTLDPQKMSPEERDIPDQLEKDVDRYERLEVEKANLLERKQHQESTREAWKTTLLKVAISC